MAGGWVTGLRHGHVAGQAGRRCFRQALIVAILGLFSCPSTADGLAEEESCSANLREVALSLPQHGLVSVEYLLDRAVDSFKLPLPDRHFEDVIVEAGKITPNNQGVMHLPTPSNQIRIALRPEPPERRRAGVYPLAFAVEGRGVGVYLPYLLPKACRELAVRLKAGAGVAAVVDGAYRRMESEYQISHVGGFILLGNNLTPNSVVQTPTSLPAWLGRAIRESYRKGQTEIIDVMGGHRMQVPLLVDFSAVGGGKQSKVGGDAPGNTIRLWFRGNVWAQESKALRERMNDVLLHELIHCHQVPETWQQWAHEGHARFIELLVAARRDGEPSSHRRAEQRLSHDFDGCMNDLRIGESVISPYACGAVAYWLRWLKYGLVNMLTREGTRKLVKEQSVSGRFLQRTASEGEVAQFVRSQGIAIEVRKEARESPESVRWRMIMALLRQQCGAISALGFWTNEGSLTLDAPNCSLLHGFELKAIAGYDIIREVQQGYAALADSCAKQGRVPAAGINDEPKWIECERSFQWPTTLRTQYRLIGPLERAAVVGDASEARWRTRSPQN